MAAWTLLMRGDRIAVVDPAADALATLLRSVFRQGIVPALFGPEGWFAHAWVATEMDQATVRAGLSDLDS